MLPENTRPRVDAEESLLACCLLDGGDSVSACLEAGVSIKSFYSPGNRIIFDTLCELFGAGHQVSAPIVAIELNKKGLLDAIGGYVQLNHITNLLPTTAQRAYYIQQVRDAQIRRDLVSIAGKAIEDCQNSTAPTSELVNGVAQEILNISASTAVAQESQKDIGKRIIEDTRRLMRGEDALRTLIHWPWKTFNKFASPIEPHEMVVIGARPMQGKTSSASQLIYAALTAGLRVLHFNLETSRERTFRAMASQAAGVNLRALKEEFPEKVTAFEKTVDAITNMESYRVFDNFMRLEDIQAQCRIAAKVWKPDLVVVDHLHLIRVKGGSRYEQVTEVSGGLMEARKWLGCAMVVLAQLNRANEEDDRPPKMSDLRDSGSVEQDARRIVLIHRPTKDANGMTQVGIDTPQNKTIFDQYLMQVKNGEGPLFNSRIKFHAPTTRFYEE